jgi:hypothetical protein
MGGSVANGPVKPGQRRQEELDPVSSPRPAQIPDRTKFEVSHIHSQVIDILFDRLFVTFMITALRDQPIGQGGLRWRHIAAGKCADSGISHAMLRSASESPPPWVPVHGYA